MALVAVVRVLLLLLALLAPLLLAPLPALVPLVAVLPPEATEAAGELRGSSGSIVPFSLGPARLLVKRHFS